MNLASRPPHPFGTSDSLRGGGLDIFWNYTLRSDKISKETFFISHFFVTVVIQKVLSNNFKNSISDPSIPTWSASLGRLVWSYFGLPVTLDLYKGSGSGIPLLVDFLGLVYGSSQAWNKYRDLFAILHLLTVCQFHSFVRCAFFSYLCYICLWNF